jgi:lysophospholipase L1-like esterase
MERIRPAGVIAAIAALAAFAHPAAAKPIPVGARYVALGSSFASGPGVTQSADTPPNRCTRSTDNYPRQVARKHKLNLVDVSCSGATTAHILGPWAELPPQIDAVTSDTKLVTITIGGNDVGYIGRLIGQSCEQERGNAKAAPAAQAFCKSFPAVSIFPMPDAARFARLEADLKAVATEVHKRAPDARIIFVQYLTVLPKTGGCAALPLSTEQAETTRAVGAGVADATARAATATGADLVASTILSKGHDVCAAKPWVFGFATPGGPPVLIPYHPNLDGMTALADAIDAVITR